MKPTMPRRKRPGGALRGKPVQGPKGEWYNALGERINYSVDLAYSRAFWKSFKHKAVAQGRYKIMRETIQNDAEKHGQIAILVGPQITEESKAEMSAYRVLAKKMGYQIGLFTHHKRAHTATAPIKKIAKK